ncbi:hypothetical protein B0H19DRAFT_1375971 [Mycena capillaripes]|nr:hypothetical protein B0H19DRAFT_1375971 [Mycena capillaripes]
MRKRYVDQVSTMLRPLETAAQHGGGTKAGLEEVEGGIRRHETNGGVETKRDEALDEAGIVALTCRAFDPTEADGLQGCQWTRDFLTHSLNILGARYTQLCATSEQHSHLFAPTLPSPGTRTESPHLCSSASLGDELFYYIKELTVSDCVLTRKISCLLLDLSPEIQKLCHPLSFIIPDPIPTTAAAHGVDARNFRPLCTYNPRAAASKGSTNSARDKCRDHCVIRRGFLSIRPFFILKTSDFVFWHSIRPPFTISYNDGELFPSYIARIPVRDHSNHPAKPKVSEIVGGGFAILTVIFGFFIWRYLFLRAKRRKLVKQQTKGDGEAAAGAREMEELPRRTDAAEPDSPMRAESKVAQAVQTPSRLNDTTVPAITVESVEDKGSIREVVMDSGERTARTATAVKRAPTKRTREVASVGGHREQLQPHTDRIYPGVYKTDSRVPQRAREIQSPPTRIHTTSQGVETGDENPFTDEEVAYLGGDIESQPTPTDTHYTDYPAVGGTESAASTQRTVAPAMKTIDRPNSTSDTQSKIVLRLPLRANEVRAIEKQREAFGKIGRLAELKEAVSATGVPPETTGSMGSAESSAEAATSGSTADLESARRQNELLRQRIRELEEQQRLDREQGLSDHPPPVYNE